MNVPVNMAMMPNVELLDAAWFLVYTSGSLIIPNADTRDKNAPANIKAPERNLKISVIFDDFPFLKEFRKRNGADE